MFASRVCPSLHKIEHFLDAFTDVGLMPTLSETGSVSTRIKTDRSPSVYQRDIWNTDATWADATKPCGKRNNGRRLLSASHCEIGGVYGCPANASVLGLQNTSRAMFRGHPAAGYTLTLRQEGHRMSDAEALCNATSWVTVARNAERVSSLAGRLQKVLHRHFGVGYQVEALKAAAHASTHMYVLLGAPWDVGWLAEDDLGMVLAAQSIALGSLRKVPPVTAKTIRDNGSPFSALFELEQVEDSLGDVTGILSRENLRDFADGHSALCGNGEAPKVISDYLESVPFTDEGTNDTVEDVVSWCGFLPPVMGCT